MRSMVLLGLALLLSPMLAGGSPQVPSVHAAQETVQAAIAPGLLFGVASSGPQRVRNLYQINLSTGAASLIGPVGFKQVSGMDFNPFTGVLYATGRRTADDTEVLITIDPATGAGTEVGPLGTIAFVTDISFRGSDAALFGVTDEGSLIRINIATGAQTILSRFCSGLDGNGIAFSPNDVLYHADSLQLLVLDQTSCARTLVNSLKFPAGLGSNPRVSAMDFQPGAIALYANVITGQGFVGEGGPAYLGTINTITGDVVIIGPTANRMDALAWSPGPTAVFDMCLQDETNGAILQLNSATGAYQFTNCLGLTSGGVGTITRRGCLVTLEVNGPDRRVLARIDTCMRNGVAAVQVFSPSRTFTILDRNTSNNTCACPGG